MDVKVKCKGFIAFFAQTICTSVALGSQNPAIVAAAQTIGAVVSEAVNSIDISEKKDAPVQLFIDTFEKVLRESINETFVTNGKDEEIIAELKEIKLSDCQIMNEENKKALNVAIIEILKENGVYTDNISVGTIDGFIDSINSKMCDEINKSDSLLLFATNQEVKDIGITVKSTDKKVDNINEQINEVLAEQEEHGKLLRQIAECTSPSNSPILQSRPDSDFINAIHRNKRYYTDKWKDRLFLHKSKNDKPLTLENTFIHHDYSVIDQNTGETISENNSDIEKYLEEFIDNKICDSLLVTGVPGMGKSSLVAYLANKYANDDSVIILRFKDFWGQYLTDNSYMPDYSGLHIAISKVLGIGVEDFDTFIDGKTFILDGFDELKNYSINQKVLKDFIDILDYNRNIGLIVTSRENYVDLNKVQFNSYLSLESFSVMKIREYYRVIKGEKLAKNIQINKEEVLGIPVILYMALVVGIDINSNESRSELYERIFDIDKGVFERFKSWETGGHPVKYDKHALHELLQQLAFYIFEHDGRPVDENIYVGMAREIKNSKNEPAFSSDTRTILDFPIKNLYEGSGRIEFVHNSIYEYFTAEYMYQEIKRGLADNDKEKFAGVLGRLFKKNVLSKEVIEYLYYKMSVDISNGSNQFFVDTFDLMLKKGMTYYTKECYENVIICEGRVFANMLELLHAWDYTFKFDHLIRAYTSCSYYANAKLNLKGTNLAATFLDNINLSGADLKGVNLRETDLRGADLKEADLSGADLYKVDLNEADLKGADLRGANLKEADLSEVDLYRANLSGADLYKADLWGADLYKANLSGADLSHANLSEADLWGADLYKANLSHANLLRTDLQKADIRQADLLGAIFDINNIQIIEEQLPEAVSDVLVYIYSLGKTVSYQEYKELSQKGLC